MHPFAKFKGVHAQAPWSMIPPCLPFPCYPFSRLSSGSGEIAAVLHIVEAGGRCSFYALTSTLTVPALNPPPPHVIPEMLCVQVYTSARHPT